MLHKYNYVALSFFCFTTDNLFCNLETMLQLYKSFYEFNVLFMKLMYNKWLRRSFNQSVISAFGSDCMHKISSIKLKMVDIQGDI